MRGYTPLNGNIYINDDPINTDKNSLNDTNYQNSNDTLSHQKNKGIINKDITNISETENNKEKNNRIIEKIHKGGEYTEASIDKMRDFLISLYTKFTKKEEPIIDYDAKNVINNNIINKQDIEEVSNKQDLTISVTKNTSSLNFTENEILFLKDFVKNKNTKETPKPNLKSEEKLEIINKIINNNVLDEINKEFINQFDEPLFINNADFKQNENSEENEIKQEIKTTNAGLVNTSPKQDNIIKGGPLPSPFDPVKMDEINESKNLKTINENELEKEDLKKVG